MSSFQCDKCFVILKHKQTLERHLKRCKTKKEDEEKRREENEKNEKKLREENTSLLKGMYDLKCEIYSLKEVHILNLETLKSEIEVLKKELLKKTNDHIEEMENITGHYLASKTDIEGLRKETEGLRTINSLLKIQNNKHIEKLYKMADTPKVLNQNTINNTKLNSSTVNNNVIQLQPFDLNDEKIEALFTSTFDNLSNEEFEGYMKGGQQGIASAVINEVFLKNGENTSYHTSDASRHIFEYKNRDGQVVKDNKAFRLSKLIHSKVIERTKDVTKKHLSETNDYDLKNLINQRLTDISTLPKDNKKFCNQLVKMIEK